MSAQTYPLTLDDDRVLSIATCAQVLDFSLAHTRRMYRTGKIPAPIQIGGRKKGYTVRMIKKIIADRSQEVRS